MKTLIVGAGSAGAVIASRLSERSDQEVVLVEAGPDYPLPQAQPDDLTDGRKNSMRAHDWGFRHRPTARPNHHVFPRGKVVGGSSSVNTCIALRGRPQDFDEWASLGLDAWGYDRCLPAFRRLETDMDFDDEWHGRDGPIPVRRHPPDEWVPWQAAFVEAARGLGFAACDDHNSPHASGGVGPHAMNKIDGRRMSASLCYLTPSVRNRTNLSIVSRTLVRRVLFENRKAIGIEVEVMGQVTRMLADRVVLCAGALLTPGILLRSGVGPSASVRAIQVELVADVRAVGARLLDHPGAAIFLAARAGVAHAGDPLIQNLLRFTSEGSGFADDMQVQPGSVLPLPLVTLPTVTMMTCVGKPRGTGTIQFRSADANERPRIESALLSHPDDKRKAVEGIEIAWRCTRTKPMRKLAFPFWPEPATFRTRDSIGDWILRATGSGYHPCGTVPMGPEGAQDAAVDQYGRVRGVDGLIVADASIMPTIPSSNTNVPTLMIGERFGEWLRDGAVY